MPTQNKHCTKCNQDLKPANFNKDSSQKDGYHATCKKCVNKYNKCSLSGRFHHYKNTARHRNYAFTLTKKQFEAITSQPCEFCGDFIGEDNLGRPYNGVDRIDNDKGYIKGNCCPCCTKCNFMKAQQSKDEFLAQIIAIYEFQKRKG
ncbi:MAG: hypothetical protein WC523_03875 [Patescibacteria group bacterium]